MKDNEKTMATVLNNKLMVEGFNPDDYKQYYDDGTPYLPFKVQLAWFRAKYPNGKLPVFRPEWSADKEVNTFVATARVYKDATDPQDGYLAEASAKRGPGLKIHDSGEEIDPYSAVQVAAMSLALKLAGFWCSLTTDDLTKELERANSETQEKAGEESAEKQTEPAEEKKAGKRGRKKATNGGSAPAENANTAADTGTAPVENAETAANADSAPVENAETAANAGSAPTENAGTAANADSAPVENAETAVNAGTAPVKNVETAANADATANAGTASAENSETTTNAGFAPVKNVETAANASSVENPQVSVEYLRSVPFANGYYDGTVGDLEQKKIDGDTLASNLYDWLLTSKMARKKFETAANAAVELAKQIHPDWLESNN